MLLTGTRWNAIKGKMSVFGMEREKEKERTREREMGEIDGEMGYCNN